MAARDLLAVGLIVLSSTACHAVSGAGDFSVSDGGADAGAGAGGQGGAAPATCHPPGLVDAFDGDDIDRELWAVQGAPENIGVSRGMLRITPPPATMAAAWIGLQSVARYDVKECAVWIRVTAVAAGTTYFKLDHQDGPAIFEVQNGILNMGVGGEVRETLSYVPPEDFQWWRFRDEGDVLHFETSPDGIDWTSQHDVPSPSFIGDVEVGVGVVPAPTISQEVEAQFDNLDVQP